MITVGRVIEGVVAVVVVGSVGSGSPPLVVAVVLLVGVVGVGSVGSGAVVALVGGAVVVVVAVVGAVVGRGAGRGAGARTTSAGASVLGVGPMGRVTGPWGDEELPGPAPASDEDPGPDSAVGPSTARTSKTGSLTSLGRRDRSRAT